MELNRRSFLIQSGSAGMLLATHGLLAEDTTADIDRIRSIATFTAMTFDTTTPVPFGADILDTKTGERLMRSVNAVGPDHDPSAHAETLTIRLACEKLGKASLAGYTLYTTCEPCPMCMACALWAGLDRVVFGATIEDANKFVSQIRVPAKEVAARSDMKCVVDGPVERDECVKLFTDPRMQRAFALWKRK
jgi:tRNA(Arg) A34 adenosine deaminase TadA